MIKPKPVMLDFYCGRGGWTHGFLAHGFECHGFDMQNFSGVYPGIFHLADLRTVKAESIRFDGRVRIICASSPCDEFARFTMPWTRAKNPPEPVLAIELARIPFLLAGSLGVPLVFENVRSAQRWLGRAVNFVGPFCLWGDGVPALLPKEVERRAKESYGSKEKDKRAEIPFPLADWIARVWANACAQESR